MSHPLSGRVTLDSLGGPGVLAGVPYMGKGRINVGEMQREKYSMPIAGCE